MLFALPWEGRLLVGTGHAGLAPGAEPRLPRDELERFVADVASALPGAGIGPERVVRVYAGLLPAARAGSAALTKRPAILGPAQTGAPEGLWTLTGVKLTTARHVAEELLHSARSVRGGRRRDRRATRVRRNARRGFGSGRGGTPRTIRMASRSCRR